MSHLKVNKPIAKAHIKYPDEYKDHLNHKISKLAQQNLKLKQEFNDMMRLFRQQQKQMVILGKAQSDYLKRARNG